MNIWEKKQKNTSKQGPSVPADPDSLGETNTSPSFLNPVLVETYLIVQRGGEGNVRALRILRDHPHSLNGITKAHRE